MLTKNTYMYQEHFAGLSQKFVVDGIITTTWFICIVGADG